MSTSAKTGIEVRRGTTDVGDVLPVLVTSGGVGLAIIVAGLGYRSE